VLTDDGTRTKNLVPIRYTITAPSKLFLYNDGVREPEPVPTQVRLRGNAGPTTTTWGNLAMEPPLARGPGGAAGGSGRRG
jgi:hypothetical protein